MDRLGGLFVAASSPRWLSRTRGIPPAAAGYPGAMPDPLPADPSVRVVETLLHAVLREKNFDVASELLADDVVYENVGYSTMRGGQRIVQTFRAMSARLPMVNWDVEIHRTVSQGTRLMNERTDSLIVGPFRADFWVCGVFEVSDGKVLLWRDYFDLLDLVKGMLRGLAALAIPSMRRSSPAAV
jgi:limonene-1,2-epoxide hydrolase